MVRLIPVFVAFSVLLGGAISSKADADRNAAQFAAFKAVAFSSVGSISVAQITDPQGAPITDSKEHDIPQPAYGDFHGCKLISGWSVVASRFQGGLVDILKRPIDFWVKTYAAAGDKDIVVNASFCMPNFGYAARFETSDGPRDVLICLQCGQIEVFAGNQSVEFDLNESDLIKLKAYYVDEFILKTGVNRQPRPPK